jgi:class 3 adenylate cyclase/tetratricopeptide (TPR) repeat protein
MTDIRQWLEQRGLGKHADLLLEHEVDLEVLSELEESDLESIGIALGPRKKLLKAIRERESSQSEEPATPSPPTGDAERRQLTVMFADLVGSTELSQRLDPEDLREINRTYQDAATAAIEKYEGFVARYMGDGVLAYFGYPRAHEDDAERAIRAGMALTESVHSLHAGVALAVRVGIATGPVVVGDIVGKGAAQESAVVGETPNLAARLQGIAEPDTVVLSEATRQLVSGRFELDALGPQSLKGIDRRVQAYRACAVRGVSRFDAARGRRVTPLVGRDEELEMLLRRWRSATEGDGQTILLSGEAGVGKSRIVRALQDSLSGSLSSRVLYYCSPYHRSTAFHPVIEQLERVARITPDQTSQEKLSSLRSTIGKLEMDPEESIPFLAGLLSIPYDNLDAMGDLTPEQLRLRTLDVLVHGVEAMAASGPVLFVVEDAHWIDPSTQDFLTHLIGRIRSTEILAVITHRPEYEPPWTDYPNVTALALNNLGRRDSAAMVAEVVGGGRLPESMIEEIIERTDGVPLFIEEVSTAFSDAGADSSAADIPVTLQDLLMERLDRLGSAKEVAQRAAVIGRSFEVDLLGAASGMDRQVLEPELARLVDSGLIFGRMGAESSYEFKHALVRDTAYQSLLKSDRQRCHQRIAAALEQAAGDNPPLELLAHHFEEGGHPDKAAHNWRLAGERALGRFAHAEAISDFRRALAIVDSLPEDSARLRFELETQMQLGPSLSYVLGQGAPEVEQTYVRSIELGEQLNDPAASFTSAWGMWRLHFARGDMRTGHDFALRCQQASARSIGPMAKLGTAFALGATSLFSGDCSEAAPYLEESIELYRGMDDKSALAVFGQDPGISSLAYLSWASWLVGFPDRALVPCEEAVRIARDTGKPVLIAIATGFAGMTFSMRRDISSLIEHAEESLAICDQHGFRQHACMCNVVLGYAYSQTGDHNRAVASAEEGLNEKISLGTHIALPWFCYLVAEAYAAAGRLGDALEVARKGADFAERGGERFFEYENRRMQALVLALDPDSSPTEIQSHLDASLAIARAQGSPSLELRSALTYARILAGKGDRAQASELLSPIVGSFTEGWNSPDLEEAKSLLDELARS